MRTIGRFELTPYRIRLGLDVLTGLVIVSVAFALAGLTWRIAGHAGTGAIMVPSAPRAAPVPDLAPALAFAPFGRPASNGDGAQPTTLQVTLKGLVYARPASLSVAWISAGSEQAKPLKVGDAVAGATIDAIEPRRVLLRNGGRVESLTFPDPFAVQSAPAAGGAPPQPGQAPAPAAPGAPAVAPAPPSAPTGDLMSKFDARPVSGGYQVGGNAPPGLQPGDVVQSVNGTQLANSDAARSAFAAAQQAGNAQIQIVRDGKRVTLTVPIR